MEAAELISVVFEGDPAKPTNISEHDVTEEQLKACLACLKARFVRPVAKDSVAQEAAERFGVDAEYAAGDLLPTGAKGLELLYKKKELALLRLKFQFMRHGLMDIDASAVMDDTGGSMFRTDFVRVHECMRRLYDVLQSDLLARKSLDPSWASECPNQNDPFGLQPFDDNKLSDYQSFIVYALEYAQMRGYRRYKGSVYEQVESQPIVGHDGRPRRYKTHAWVRVCDIKDMVMSCAPKETHFAQWQHMLTGNNLENAVRYLTTCNEANFSELKPDRHWHAFQNGLYHTLSAEFYPWGTRYVSPDVVACKYHTIEFDTKNTQAEHFMDIPTPHFDKILRYQMQAGIEPNEQDNVIMWIYALMGRLLFEVNELDSWQVAPFFVGRAGTGKSLVLKTVGWFFNDEDVETMSNNVQKGFGLETFVDKLMWRCLEVKSDFGLDQAQLQSMITGEELSIMRKGKPAINVVWSVPGIMAGNELANWTDNSGSMSRRLILIYFLRFVVNSNPNLDQLIKLELGALIHKCCCAYLGTVEMYGKCDLWGNQMDANGKELLNDEGKTMPILPMYFHDNKEKVKQETHPLRSFLKNCDKVMVVGPETGNGMPMAVMQEIANKYFADKNMGKFAWNKKDSYRSTMEDVGLQMRKLTKADITRMAGVGAQTMEYDYKVYADGTEWIFGLEVRTHKVREGIADAMDEL